MKDLSSNRLETLCIDGFLERFPFLEKVICYKNLISSVIVPCSVDRLTHLNLNRNQIVNLDFEALNNLSGLRYLNLNNNQIQLLPEVPIATFRPAQRITLHRLKEFHIDNNRLKKLPLWVCCLQNLEVLSLQRNELTFLPSDLVKCKKLRSLNFGNNFITALPISFYLFRFTSNEAEQADSVLKGNALKVLDYQGNPLDFPPLHLCRKGNEEIFKFLLQASKLSLAGTSVNLAQSSRKKCKKPPAIPKKPAGLTLKVERRRKENGEKAQFNTSNNSATTQKELPLKLCKVPSKQKCDTCKESVQTISRKAKDLRPNIKSKPEYLKKRVADERMRRVQEFLCNEVVDSDLLCSKRIAHEVKHTFKVRAFRTCGLILNLI